MLRTFLLAIMLLAAVPASWAQLDSLVWGAGTVGVDPSEKGELRMAVEVMPFLRDNEYKGDYVKGYTLPGAWLQPRVSYQPLHNLKLEVGAHMLHFWGAEKYPNFNYSALAQWQGRNVQNGFHCVPVVRAHMQLTPTLNVVLGTLYGKSNHALAEPLYNDELNLSGDPETGVQVVWDCRPLRLDAWVNWESFIFKNDDGQESFSFGLSARVRPSRKEARLQWYLPMQMLFQHRGGEVNTDASERAIKTWLNAAAGAGVDVPLDAKFPASLNFEALACYFGQQAGNLLPYDSGWGAYAKATARLWRVKASVGYWKCHNFISIHGNPLFGAMGINDENVLYHDPQMLTAHAEYAQQLGKGFAWGVGIDIYHHFKADESKGGAPYVQTNGGTSLAAGIYLRACPSFLIKKFK